VSDADLTIPELSLVVLVGASGSGKSTFAQRHFRPTEILSSDWCRGVVSDDENDQGATKDAFAVLHFVAAKRLARGRLTVVDATNVQPEARKPLVALAREYHCLPVAIVLDLPERLCQDRNRGRPDRTFGPHVVRNQIGHLRRSMRTLKREGFRHVHVLRSPEEVDSARIARTRLWNDRRDDHGPFDIIGDVHGCFDELRALLAELGYELHDAPEGPHVRHPDGRRAVFLGDLVDRGPAVPGVLRLVMGMVADGTALCVPGNHDTKLMRKLRGRDVRITHGLAESLEQLERAPKVWVAQVPDFIDGLVSHYVMDDGRLVVAHAGMPEGMQGRGSSKVREFALYGETTGETDEYGLPVRYPWADDYRGGATVVYGHTPVAEPEWVNRTICIDTGCVFGGRLTALRYPERELVSVPAARTYYAPARPLADVAPPALSTQQQLDDVLDLDDVIGKRFITTRLRNVTIREGNAAAALEVMSRFATNPKWIIYLPPTMSPSETSQKPGLLEHPSEAFAFFRSQGVGRVVCEEKHMGSRAVAIVCRDAEIARSRFGVADGGIGVVYTRTGRPFFSDGAMQGELLQRIARALDGAGVWRELDTGWVCLDCELMPWSAKAQELIRTQYAALGAAAGAGLGSVVGALESAVARGLDVTALLARAGERVRAVDAFVRAYRRYAWPVESVDDLKLATFHLMASEGGVHVDRDHLWHLALLSRLAAHDPVLITTEHRVVDLTEAASEEAATRWWEDLTARGGEGMVVKPLDFVARGTRGVVQPALKVRGSEYLRLIYGPEYLLPEHLERLRARGLSAKRALALQEFALGIEALERFVRREPLRRVHECVFGVLALESEAVDPRL
jgi:protein phosphatase